MGATAGVDDTRAELMPDHRHHWDENATEEDTARADPAVPGNQGTGFAERTGVSFPERYCLSVR
jgi:hypothetical protein